MRLYPAALAAALAMMLSTGGLAVADPVKFDALLTPKEQIRLNFEDGSNHFVLLIRREGKSGGQGPLSGATVTEYGMHDIVPGVSGEPRGYLKFAKDGDIAYIRWLIHASFVPGPDGKPKLLDNGLWEVVGATGKLKGLKGAGTFHLRPEGQADRRFTLEGELVTPK